MRYALLLLCFIVDMDNVQSQAIQSEIKSSDLKRQLIFSDDFSSGLDTLLWIAEIEPLPGSTVSVNQGKLCLNTKGGVTVWLNKVLRGNIQIEYTRKVIVENGDNDRLSDFNQFWMAHDSRKDNLFTRYGKFEEYDSLNLYYVGVGGNSNTTTRFRKYTGNGDRLLLQEFSSGDHLLQPNREYYIKTIVDDNTTSFYMDEQCYFIFRDPEVLKEGYFGFRSTHSNQEIDNVRIYQLD